MKSKVPNHVFNGAGYDKGSSMGCLEWKAGLKDDMDARSDVYVLSNDCRNVVTTAMTITRSIHQIKQREMYLV
ncbi:hypothetical protein Tco_0267690 [Tanacetum coccineum]